jgi:hypothetical protein
MDETAHQVSTRVPVDSLVGEEMVIFRSSRGSRRHDGVLRGRCVEIVGSGDRASGVALANAAVYPFRRIPEADIRRGYTAHARTRESLLECMKKMYDGNYDDNTPTTVIRLLRTE